MFTNLSFKFSNKKKTLSEQELVQGNVSSIISNFLDNNLGLKKMGVKFEYSPKNKILSITAPNKIIASEINFRSTEILKSLLSKEVLVSRIRVL